MGGAINALGNKLFAGSVPIENIVTKFQEEGEKARTEMQDKIDLGDSSLHEISKLQSIITSLKVKANQITDPLQSSFYSKNFSIALEENARNLQGSDFLKNIKIDNDAILGSTEVKVQQLAKAASCVIELEKYDGGTAGLSSKDPLNLDGSIKLSLNKQISNIQIDAQDNLDKIIEKINQSIVSKDLEYTAFKIKGENNTCFIGIRSNKTGMDNSIEFGEFKFTPQGNTDILSIKAGSEKPSQNSKVYINGIEHNQPLNYFAEVIPGISFEVTRTNTSSDPNHIEYENLKHTEILVSQDNTPVKKMLLDFGNLLNELSHFVAKNNRSSQSVENFKYMDPTQDFGSFDRSDAPLRNSYLLNEVESLLTKVTMRRSNPEDDTGSVSLLDFGFELKQVQKEGDDFKHEELVFSDQNKFEKLFNDDFQKIYDFFVTNVKIAPNNNNGYVQYIPSDSSSTITDSSLINKDIDLEITYDANGNNKKVTKVIASINGQQISKGSVKYNGNTKRYDVSFETEKNKSKNVLEGLFFSVDPRNADGVEHSIIKYNPGLINEIRDYSRTILTDDGFNGVSVAEGNYIQDKITADKKSLEEVDNHFKKSIEEMKQVESQLAFMEQQTNLILASIEAILGDN
jgi:hypothetical protein